MRGSGETIVSHFLLDLITTAGDDTNSICYEVHQKAKDILEETSGYYIKDMITNIDLDKSRMWILNHFFEKEHVIEESRFLDYKSIIKFIDDTVEYIKKRLLDEKFLINKSRIEKQGNGG